MVTDDNRLGIFLAHYAKKELNIPARGRVGPNSITPLLSKHSKVKYADIKKNAKYSAGEKATRTTLAVVKTMPVVTGKPGK